MQKGLVELLHLAKRVDELITSLLDIVDETGLLKDLDCGECCCTGDRVTIRRATVAPSHPLLVESATRTDCREREP